jgi:hypothetical protein
MELRPYAPPSFFTTQGVWAKQRQLERKGFPSDLRDWRFVTLTFDRKNYSDPFMAWALGKRHLRQFVYLLKKKYGIRRWCWKLEFHEPDDDGQVWPHWHILFDYKQRIDKDELRALWGKGRTEIQRVKGEKFEYLFKYAAKGIENVPDWILSRTTVRFFQTSKGFFPPTPKTLSADDVEKQNDAIASPRDTGTGPTRETQNYRIPSETIGERLERWSRYVVSRSISDDGKVIHRVLEMTCQSWGQLLVRLGRIKIQSGIPSSDLHVTENCIQTSCLNLLPRYLPAFT